MSKERRALCHRLQQARLAGIPVFYGEIPSAASEQALDLRDFDHLLAATENDAYNALVCTRFAPELARNRAYQLPQVAAETASSTRLNHTLCGLAAYG